MKKYLTSIILIAALIVPTAIAAQQYIYYSTNGTSATNASTASGCINLTSNLRYLDTDAKTAGGVTKLQQFLYAKGYLSVAPTGYFGTMTKASVTKFQNEYGLVPNPPAFVGPQTRAKITALTCGSETVSTTASSPTDCKAGDTFSIKTGLRCNATENITPAQMFTNTSTTTQTTTITNAPPLVLPYMRILSVVPLQTQASTTRTVYLTWTAESMTTLDIALMNNTTNNVIVIASSTPNDENQTVTLSSAVIPDGTYSMMIYWPTNHLAFSTSPIGTVRVASKLITIVQYPSATSSQSTSNYTSDAQAIQDYLANAEEIQKTVEEKKKKVKDADTPAEKQSALQELCSGFKFYINPIDCSLINLTGI